MQARHLGQVTQPALCLTGQQEEPLSSGAGSSPSSPSTHSQH